MQRRADWHLAWARRVGERFHGPVSLAQLSAPTLGDGVAVFARYMPQRVPYMMWRGRTSADGYRVSLRPRMALGALGPLLAEIPLLSLVCYVNSVRTGVLDGLRAEFRHAALVPPATYRQWFDCGFRFGGADDAVVVPAAWLPISNVGHDAALWQSALAQCAAAARGRRTAARRGIEATVRAALRGAFASAGDAPKPPTLEAMAGRLGLSSRTLSRRLFEAGVSYRALVGALRRELARDLLAEGLRVGEVSQALGYANTSAFDRAYRRWYDAAPRHAQRTVPVPARL